MYADGDGFHSSDKAAFDTSFSRTELVQEGDPRLWTNSWSLVLGSADLLWEKESRVVARMFSLDGKLSGPTPSLYLPSGSLLLCQSLIFLDGEQASSSLMILAFKARLTAGITASRRLIPKIAIVPEFHTCLQNSSRSLLSWGMVFARALRLIFERQAFNSSCPSP